MSVIIFIIILLVLVIVHECGHFFTAKKFGIRVDEFGFGFPPKLFGKKFGETEYTVNLLPLGGFVKIFGENPDEEGSDGPDRARSFVHRPKWQQALVLIAGVLSNFLLAWLLFSIGFLSGLPASVGTLGEKYPLGDVHTVIVSVAPDSPAEKAGLESGDKIFNIQNKDWSPSGNSPDTIKGVIAESKGEEVEIGYIRGKDEFIGSNVQFVKLIPATNDTGKLAIGISMDQIGTVRLGPISALSEGFRLTLSVTKGTFVGLYNLVKDSVRGEGSLDSVTGPVGMVGIVDDAYKFGIVYLLSFAALISINLAIINLLPFPALDGGRLFFLLIEKIKGSPINSKIANNANMIGFALLLLLMLVVTFHDIVKLI